MQARNSFLIIAAICMAAAIIATRLALRSAQELPSDNNIDSAIPGTLAKSLADVQSKIDVALDSLGHIGSRPTSVKSLASQPASASGARCEWPNPLRRNDVPLAGMILAGSIDINYLARHVLLNRNDTILCPPDLAELEAVLERCRSIMAPVAEAFAVARHYEMLESIKSGRVPPLETPAYDDLAVARKARRQYQTLVESGRTADLVEITATLMKNRPHEAPRESYVQHAGKFYAQAGIRDLPQTEASYQIVKGIACECMGAIVAWFVDRGLTYYDKELLDCLHELVSAAALTRTEVKSVSNNGK